MAQQAAEAFCRAVAATCPELAAELAEHIEFNEKVLPHVFFGDVSRYAAACVNDDALDKLGPLLDQIEAGLEGGDPDVVNVIWVSFVEHERGMTEICKIAGPRLRAAIDGMNS